MMFEDALIEAYVEIDLRLMDAKNAKKYGLETEYSPAGLTRRIATLGAIRTALQKELKARGLEQ